VSSGDATGISGAFQKSLLLGSIHPDVRGVVYAAAAMSGNATIYSQLQQLYKQVREIAVKVIIHGFSQILTKLKLECYRTIKQDES